MFWFTLVILKHIDLTFSFFSFLFLPSFLFFFPQGGGGSVSWPMLTSNSLCNQRWQWTDLAFNNNFWDYQCASPCQVYAMMGIESRARASCMLVKLPSYIISPLDVSTEKIWNIDISSSSIYVTMINTLTESNIREEMIYMAYNFKLQSIIFGESQDSNSSSWSHFIHSQEQKENKYIPACLPRLAFFSFLVFRIKVWTFLHPLKIKAFPQSCTYQLTRSGQFLIECPSQAVLGVSS